MRPRTPLLAAIALGLLTALAAFGCEMPKSKKRPVTPAGAPAGATFLPRDVGPRDVYFGVAAAAKADRAAAKAALVGLWTDPAGWEGDVESISREGDQWCIVIYLTEPRVIGGGIWLYALVPDAKKPDVDRRYVVEVSGRVADIDPGAGPNARVILDGVTVLKSRRGN